MEEENLLENVNKVGGYLQPGIEVSGREYAAAKEVRGRGFIQGIELEIPARPIVEQALAEGVFFNSTQDTVVRFLPPFAAAGEACGQGNPRASKVPWQKAPNAPL